MFLKVKNHILEGKYELQTVCVCKDLFYLFEKQI